MSPSKLEEGQPPHGLGGSTAHDREASEVNLGEEAEAQRDVWRDGQDPFVFALPVGYARDGGLVHNLVVRLLVTDVHVPVAVASSL
eukprot:8212399-Pyramimonas_sp.AAC.1